MMCFSLAISFLSLKSGLWEDTLSQDLYVWSHAGCATLIDDGITKYDNTTQMNKRAKFESLVKKRRLKLKTKMKIKVNQSQKQ